MFFNSHECNFKRKLKLLTKIFLPLLSKLNPSLYKMSQPQILQLSIKFTPSLVQRICSRANIFSNNGNLIVLYAIRDKNTSLMR